jgi:hypothetical protein
VGDVSQRVVGAGHDFCLVLNDQRIVLGLLRGDALSKDAGVEASDVMELGPKTIRPDKPVETLLESPSSQGVKSWIVTTSHGALRGVLLRTEAEAALSAPAEY